MGSADFLDRISKLSPKQLALLALELQQKLERQTKAAAEPIAIIGVSCRFPGANSPEEFWNLLATGTDAVTEIPRERWDNDAYYDPNPDAPGKIATRWGGFLRGIDQFDADFFGIAPREAVNMDPQQRLVLETAWEALERAGHAPERLDRTRTGVFLGICNGDYFQLNAAGDPRHIDAYLASGSAGSVASGRLSYLLGLQGPSVSIDTACSSSLVAVHLACQSLRSGESTMAVAGGVNAILRPEVTMTLSRAHMMASDGRCKAFDSRADGFVRAEGCGMIVLKRLADAQADGDTVLAVIRATASNQDGRSSGLTAPNGPSQEAVIRDALAMASLRPADIDYVEAHGTGTSLGDPIEIQALGAALGAGRALDAPLLVGSVKTNIGHLESAAGIAGLIKVVLALCARTIPPHLHLHEKNPHVDWQSLPVAIPTKSTPWPERGVRRAGVSSFGFSGTNAHVILEEAPAPAGARVATSRERAPYVLPISGRSDAALTELAQRHVANLQAAKDDDIANICYTAGAGRAHFDRRLAVVAPDRATLISRLQAAVSSAEVPGVVRGQVIAAPEIAFLFSGQGAQYVCMGRELYASEPVFRRVIDECEEALAGLTATPLTQILFESDKSELERTANLQPALFALEVALAALWRSWGVVPAAVVGHSLGELSAACVAGMFSVADGARLVAHRGRLMQAARGTGRMVAVKADEATVRRFISRVADVSIAAINSPDQTVISGLAPGVETLLRELAASGIEAQPLEVSHAFHSSQMDEILGAFESEARRIAYREPTLQLVSNLTGEVWGTGSEAKDPAAYWRRHVREPVRFASGIATLGELGCRAFVEIGPSPVLVNMGRATLTTAGLEWLPSLRRGRSEREVIVETAARLYVAGTTLDWGAFAGPQAHQRVTLPTYPFQRKRYWVSPPAQSAAGASVRRDTRSSSGHPLIGARLETALPTFETELGLSTLPYLDAHRVGGRAVAPGALMLELARASGKLVLGADTLSVEDVQFREMLPLPEEGTQRTQIAFSNITADEATFSIYSHQSGDDGSGKWLNHAAGRVRRGPAARTDEPTLTSARARCTTSVPPDDFYSLLGQRGLDFGAAFRGIVEVNAGDRCVLGRVRLPEDAGHSGSTCAPYGVHPALLDAALQLIGVAIMRLGGDQTLVQVSLERMRLENAPREMWVYARLREAAEGATPVGDVWLFALDGAPVAALEGIGLARIALESTGTAHSDWLYEVNWRKVAAPREQRTQALLAPLGARLRAEYEPLAQKHGLQSYEQLSPQMERVSALFVARALEQLGIAFRPGERLLKQELAHRAGVQAPFARLFARMLAMLAEDGVLRDLGEQGCEVVAPLPAGDPVSESARLISSFPIFRAEIDLLTRCARYLAQVVQGTQDPLQLLFPSGDIGILEDLYRNSPSAHVHNALIREAVAGLAGDDGAGLRVIEIGAGTGATTHHAVAALPVGAEYTFTDISPLFVSRASTTFASRRGMSFQVFDVDDKTITEQGLSAHSFDMVVAANVLHATRDLERTVRKVRELLRPGGALVLLEGTRPWRWVDLTFGMTEGWWRFSDRTLRPDHALLTAQQWQGLLERCGFDRVELAPVGSGSTGQAVVLARATPIAAEVQPKAAQRWILSCDSPERGRELASACSAVGVDCVLVGRGSDSEISKALSADGSDASAIVFVASEPAATSDRSETALNDALACTSWLKALEASGSGAKLWLATRASQPVAGDEPAHFEQATLWGWGRVAALERPAIFGGVIDLPSAPSAIDAQALRDAIADAGEEDQIAVRGGERYLARLARTSISTKNAFEWRTDRTYLVTGWMGGLGLLLVRWLASRGVEHLLLVGRRDLVPGEPSTAEAERTIGELRANGLNISIARADVTDEAAMRAAVGRCGTELPQLAGVFHVAADLSAKPLDQLDEPTFRRMLLPKARGAWLLHELTQGVSLDCFVLFSSTTALWGAQGLAHYAAANQLLDSFAHWRRARGLPALSVNWGTWEVMRLASEAERAQFASAGLRPMAADAAFELLDLSLSTNRAQIAIADIDWEALKTVYEARRPRPFLREVNSVKRTERKTQATRVAAVWQFDDVPELQREEALTERVRAEVASVLGRADPAEINLTRGLFEMGMDSLMAVELRARLERRAGRSLPSTLTFNYPNVTALAGFLGKHLLAAAAPSVQVAPARVPSPAVAPVPDIVSSTDTDDMSEADLEKLLAAKLRTL